MSISDTIDTFKKGRLDIDCIEMTLTQMNQANPVSYRGKGYIRVDENGKINFKLFNVETNTNKFADLMRMLSGQPGAILAENNYFQLSATAFDGTIWKAERFLIEPNWPARTDDPIVTGKPSVLSTEWDMPEAAHSIRLHFLEEAEIPCIVDAFKFTANKRDFEVQKLDHEFIMEVRSTDTLDDHLETRIQEALRFLLAQSVSWRIMVRHDDKRARLELGSPVPRSATTRLDPPISRGSHSYLNDSWRLFTLYLDYVTKIAPRDHWHACSYHLHNACEASANSIDAWAVGLSVAVEGIVNLVALEKSELEQAEVHALADCILKLIGEHEQHSKYIGRLRGLLSMLTPVSPRDRLKHLEEQGYVAKEKIAAWTTLRNKHIHPNERDLRDRDPESYQQLFDLINNVTTLMYHVVFALIGYEGKFTDYGAHNYPTRDFPLKYPAGDSSLRQAGEQGPDA